MVFSSVGKEHADHRKRYTKINCPPRICMPQCMNTAVGNLVCNWISVAVVSLLFDIYTIRVIIQCAAHESWPVQCHIHVQTPVYCNNYNKKFSCRKETVRLLRASFFAICQVKSSQSLIRMSIAHVYKSKNNVTGRQFILRTL